MNAVSVNHIEVGGWKPPHELKIELVGNIDRLVSDDIVLVMREYGQEFQEAVAEAFERVFLTRLDGGEYRWAGRGEIAEKTAASMRLNGTGRLNGTSAGRKSNSIEDIEL